jgi:hypothetical protein
MITIVSGLPRSGTSLVMQMLAAGGFPILADNQRAPDDDNPRGYLEFEPVKSLERDASWLADAEGKAVKIVSFLLMKLPPSFDYRVIFVRRDLDEVLRSQAKMLERRGQPAGPNSDVMKSHFERHLATVDAWVTKQPRIHNPLAEAGRLTQFLQADLQLEPMAAVVDPRLYRQRAGG